MNFPTKAALVALAAGAACLAAPAFAQDDTIIVTVPHKQIVGRTSSGAPIERLSVSRVVSARDLDLRLTADVNELNRRIDFAARHACRELNARYPDSVFVPEGSSNSRTCYSDTLQSVRQQIAYRY